MNIWNKKTSNSSMIIHSHSISLQRPNLISTTNTRNSRKSFVAVTRAAIVRLSTAAIAAAFVMTSAAVAVEQPQPQPPDAETLSNVPQTLSGNCGGRECKKQRIQHPKSRKAESCTVKCVNSCIHDGDKALNITRPLVVFKQGFRSRNYCLVECSDICNLIGERDYEP